MPINKELAEDLSKQHKLKCLELYTAETPEELERVREELNAIKKQIKNNCVSWNLYDTHRNYDRKQNTMSINF